jgi:diguanylate cyclase
MLPSASLTPAQRRALRGAAALLGVLLGVAGVLAVTGTALELLHDWPFALACWAAAASAAARAVLVSSGRRPWALMAAGLTFYAAGATVWSLEVQYRVGDAFPTPSDPLFLAFYALAFAAMVLLVRAGSPVLSRTLALDVVIAALGAGAAAAWLLADAIAESAGMLGYPLLDIFALGFVAFVFAATGGRPGGCWTLLGLGFACLAAADIVYFSQLATSEYRGDRLINLTFVPGFALLALAPWRPAQARPLRFDGFLVAGVPALLGLGALAMLVIDHFRHLPTPALVLATLTLTAAMGRTLLSLQEARSATESRRQAMTDELTGLPNRRAFLGRLAEVIEVARLEGETVALLMVDLDRFKEVNDTLGHAAGDDLLASVGPRLAGAVGRDGRIARLGGDEFGVVAVVGGQEHARGLAARLERTLERPFDLRGLRIAVGASIGIALYPLHARSGEKLLQRADVAMYQAKGAGGGVELYAPERDGHSRDLLLLAADLRRAIAEEAITVVYQPKVDAVDGTVTGVEALARWRHPAYGAVAPSQFVRLAEQTGQGRLLTRLVLERALRDCARWARAGRELPVAVNLCADDLLDPRFPDEVESLLEREGLSPSLLKVEVSENIGVGEQDLPQVVLGPLRRMGVECALDSFGTGRSSLMHLRRLPVSEIKLAPSFVTGMETDHQNACIVRSTVELAGRLGLRVVAEGVEDEGTWELLREFGCDEVQGRLLSPPLSPSALELWLDEHRYAGHAQEAS